MGRVVNFDSLGGRHDMLLKLDTLRLRLGKSSLCTLNILDVIVDDEALGVEALDGSLQAVDLNLLFGDDHLSVVGLLSDDGLVLVGDEGLGTGGTESDCGRFLGRFSGTLGHCSCLREN